MSDRFPSPFEIATPKAPAVGKNVCVLIDVLGVAT